MLKTLSWRSVGIASSSFGVVLLSIVLIKLAENRSEANNVPIPTGLDITNEYLLGWIWALLLCVVLLVLPIANRTRLALLGLWIAKIATTLGFMLLYEGAYGLDAWLYYFTAVTGTDHVFAGNEYTGNTGIVNVISFLLYFQPTSYHATKVSFAFIGLAGSFAFYRAFVIYLGREDLRILLFLGLFPSILFWSSILGKDPITYFGVGLYAIGVVDILKNHRPRYLIFVFGGIALAAWIRVWYVVLLGVPLSIALLFDKRFRAIILGVFPVVLALGVLFSARIEDILLGYGLSLSLDVLKTLENVGNTFATDASATIGTPPDLSSFSSLLLSLPNGIVAMLFRPLPGEVMNPFGLLVGIENLGILFLLWRAIRNFSFKKVDCVLLWAMLYVLGWAAFHGLIILNFGSSVRFRLNMLPLLIGPLAYLAFLQPRDAQKVKALDR